MEKLLLLEKPFDPGIITRRDCEFFGPWAQPIHLPPELKKPGFEPYKDCGSIYKATVSAARVADELLSALSNSLQDVLGVKAGDRFWRVYLAGYVLTLAIIVEDIKIRQASLPGSEYILGLPSMPGSISVPRSWQDAEKLLYYGQTFRLKAFELCLGKIFPRTDKVAYQISDKRRLVSRYKNLFTHIRDGDAGSLAKKMVSRFLFIKNKNMVNPVLFWDLYHAESFKLDKFKIGLFSDTGIPGMRHLFKCNFLMDPEKRRYLAKGLSQPYDELVRMSFPLSAFEGFSYQVKTLKKEVLPLFGNVKKIYTHGHAFDSDDPKLMLAALLADEGKKIISIQHGGGGEAYCAHSQAFIERTVADEFITWGPGYSNPDGLLGSQNKSKALPSYYLSLIRNDAGKNMKKRKVFRNLIVAFEENRYIRHLYPLLFPDIAYDYFLRQTALFEYFGKCDKTAVKLYPWDYGWHQAEWVRGNYPGLTVITEGKFVSLAPRSELVVLDYNSTPFIEALAMNTPFIATWNRDLFKGNFLFERHIDKLKESRIFYEDPGALIEAHRKISSIDISDWWLDPERQRVINNMAGDFALTSNNIHEDWRNEFKDRTS